MDRRSLLGTMVAVGTIGVTGCTTIEASGPTDTTSSPSATPYPEGEQRRVSLASQDTVPDEHQVRINVEVVEPVITHQHTARLRITTINEGPRRGISINKPGCHLLDRHKAGSDPPGLWLYTPGDIPERAGNRWIPDLPSDDSRGFGDYGCRFRTYDTGDSFQNEYLLWDDHHQDGYLEPGTYRWEEPEVEIQELPNNSDSEILGTFSWGFSLTLESL